MSQVVLIEVVQQPLLESNGAPRWNEWFHPTKGTQEKQLESNFEALKGKIWLLDKIRIKISKGVSSPTKQSPWRLGAYPEQAAVAQNILTLIF